MNMTIDEPKILIRSVSTSNLIGFPPNRRADTMTLALALKGKGFVVLAADRLQTLNYEVGNYTQDADKLVEINQNCAFACAGPSTSEALLKIAIEECSGNHYASIEYKLPSLLRDKFGESYPENSNQLPYQTTYLLVMIDDDDDEFAISTLNSPKFLPTPERKFRAIGSGAQSTYFLNRIYADRKPTLEQAHLLACFCINETAKQDRFVGKRMDIWVLRKDTPIEKLTSQRIDEIRTKAEGISASIIQQFLE